MESIIILLILFVVFLVVICSLDKAWRLFRSPSHRKISDPKFPPFDAKHATRVQKKTFLKGHAHIVDGDSIIIQKTQVRLFGIDAPELNHPHGQKAKWALVALCKGQHVEAEILEIDIYGRTVALCRLQSGQDLSAEMVKLGLAIDWPKFSCGKYRALELPDVRKKLWLADARQKGRMDVWDKFDAWQKARMNGN